MSVETFTFTCEDCGDTFNRKARFARMIRNGEAEQKCRRCQRPSQASPVTDTDRRFWLTRFTDREIASFACAFFNVEFRPSIIASKRAALLGDVTPAVMLASAVELEHVVDEILEEAAA